jgi:ribonuclease Z
MGIPPGRWLNELKRAIRQGQPDTFPIIARWRENGQEKAQSFLLGDLRYQLVRESQGQKVVYVVDTLFSKDNKAKIVRLAQGADLFFCEAPFLEEDRDQATMRYHLTARQAGYLARVAAARCLVVFHFSPRYSGMGEKVYQEAQAEFRGEPPGLEDKEKLLSGWQANARQKRTELC